MDISRILSTRLAIRHCSSGKSSANTSSKRDPNKGSMAEDLNLCLVPPTPGFGSVSLAVFRAITSAETSAIMGRTAFLSGIFPTERSLELSPLKTRCSGWLAVRGQSGSSFMDASGVLNGNTFRPGSSAALRSSKANLSNSKAGTEDRSFSETSNLPYSSDEKSLSEANASLRESNLFRNSSGVSFIRPSSLNYSSRLLVMTDTAAAITRCVL